MTMAQYTLNISFTNDQLQAIYATGANVILAKSVRNHDPSVAWQVFRPVVNNTVSWEESYGLYASLTPIQNGANIVYVANTPPGALTGRVYTIASAGYISGPGADGPPGNFVIANQYTGAPSMTLGLSQDATVNGVLFQDNMIYAYTAFQMMTLMILPDTAIYLWLQPQVRSRSIVTDIPAPVSKVEFANGQNEVSVQYNSGTGLFVPVAATVG